MEYISADLMHVWCLGILQILEGNVMLDLFKRMNGVLTRLGQTVGDLLFFIKTSSKAIGLERPPINALTLEMFKGKGPNMKVNAAAGRYLLPVSIHLIKKSSSRETITKNWF